MYISSFCTYQQLLFITAQATCGDRLQLTEIKYNKYKIKECVSDMSKYNHSNSALNLCMILHSFYQPVLPMDFLETIC